MKKGKPNSKIKGAIEGEGHSSQEPKERKARRRKRTRLGCNARGVHRKVN